MTTKQPALKCPHCKKPLSEETYKQLKKEYPLVCLECDENFYKVEG